MKKMLTLAAAGRQLRIAGLRRVILRALFGALYGPGARIYDWFTRAAYAGEWQRWQKAALPSLPQSGVIVELGSGTGEFAAACAGPFDAWIALDISHEMIMIAKQHHNRLAPAFLRASADAVPLRSGVADAVISTFPSRYIFDPGVAAEIGRLLKPDGRLVVVLTGELNAVGIRRRCSRAVSAILLGDSGCDEPWVPEFAGFEGRSEWQPTAFGRSLVYVGRPMARPVDGYSRQRFDVGGPESGHPRVRRTPQSQKRSVS
jgi:SAM-dependent methyltransferase